MMAIVLIIGFVVVTSSLFVIRADIHKLGRRIMGKVEDMRAELVEINAATNRQAEASAAIATTATNIAEDVDALIANQGGGLTDADIDGLRALKAKALEAAEAIEAQKTFLESVAAKYPTTEPPPVE